AMIASPERVSPNYYYHWIRDSALAHMTAVRLYREAKGDEKNLWKKQLLNFAAFSARLQANGSLGEPKYFVDGRVYSDPWGRPQNDGPALRAITLMQFATELIRANQATVARDALVPVIVKDLQYVQSVWRQPSCDLWEEIYGDQFYTRMVQRRALIDAAAV